MWLLRSHFECVGEAALQLKGNVDGTVARSSEPVQHNGIPIAQHLVGALKLAGKGAVAADVEIAPARFKLAGGPLGGRVWARRGG